MRFYLRAISYFKDDWGKVIVSMTMLALSILLGLLQPFPLAIMIDMLSAKRSDQWIHRLFYDWIPATEPVAQIIWLAVITFALVLLQQFMQMLQTMLNIVIGYHGLMRVRCELFGKLQELSLAYHKAQPQGDAIYRLSWDTFGFQTILNVGTGAILQIVTLISMAVIMFFMDWKLTLVALAVVPPLIWIIKYYAVIMQRRSMEAKEIDTQLTTAIQRSVSSIGLVQAFGREADEYQNFHATVRSSVGAYLRLHWQEVLYWLWLGLLMGAGGALIFGYGGYLVYRDQFILQKPDGMTLGFLLVFLDYLRRLYDPLNKLSASGASIQGGVAGVKRVFEVLDRDPIIRDAPGAIHLPRQPRTLALENLSFAYREGEPVLRDVSVTIPPGQMVAFVGSSGVGKTTLLNLLPRFYDPTSGAIKLDGHDLRTVKIKDLRKHVALVLQESIILPTSVRENIAYGRPDATDAQVKKAASLAGADAFIEKLPQKYETEVSESGANLSGGQKQRISIARALLTEAPIVIMDEPTSALDPQNEMLVTETLKGLKGQRTIILVSHRLSTVADCDQIFVMEGGRLIEQGTHDALVAKRGHYYQMAKHQMKLEEKPQITPVS